MQVVENVPVHFHRNIAGTRQFETNGIPLHPARYVVRKRTDTSRVHLTFIIYGFHVNLSGKVENGHRSVLHAVFGIPHLIHLHQVGRQGFPFSPVLTYLYRKNIIQIHTLRSRISHQRRRGHTNRASRPNQ